MSFDNGKNMIRGTIRVHEKDKSGTALQLYLQTEEFEKYIINFNNVSEQLFNSLNQEVVVNCRIDDETADKYPHITIIGFRKSNQQT